MNILCVGTLSIICKVDDCFIQLFLVATIIVVATIDALCDKDQDRIIRSGVLKLISSLRKDDGLKGRDISG